MAERLNMAREVAALKRMTVKELRGRYVEVFGEATRSGNKNWLWKRIAWRMQANAEGGLMLNVLLCLAQFEREIISERTRDKLAAARRKGKWTGGRPILGYDVDPVGPKLVIHAEEAERVRAIFDLYLEKQSLIAAACELDRRGWRTKRWTTHKDHECGGQSFDKTVLFRLLTNVVYVGKVRYKDEVHAGELAELQLLDVALSILGFDDDESARILDPGIKEGLTDPDATPDPPDEAIT